MFPIDPATGQYDAKMLGAFDRLVAENHYPWTLADLLPEILPVGTPAGTLTPAGAALLDPSGTLQPGAVFCPPEGDAGTGMVATNSVAARHRECVCRHFCFCYGGSGSASCPGAPGN